jgi:hypothetical protein
MKSKRRYEDSDETEKKPEKRETCDERDRRMDKAYTFDRGPDIDLSVLAIVSRDQDEFADEFFRWWEGAKLGANPEQWREALRRFEHWRFGAELFEMAHRILGFAVRSRFDHVPQRDPITHRPRLPPAERKKRFDEAVGRKAREMAMPDVSKALSDGQVNDRQNEMLRQAEGQREPGQDG